MYLPIRSAISALVATRMRRNTERAIFEKKVSTQFNRFCCKDLALVAGHLREDEMASQAAIWNSPAMNSA